MGQRVRRWRAVVPILAPGGACVSPRSRERRVPIAETGVARAHVGRGRLSAIHSVNAAVT